MTSNQEVARDCISLKTLCEVTHCMRRTRLSQYQVSSAALGWLGDGDCYLMHKMQSGGWPIIHTFNLIYKLLIHLTFFLTTFTCHMDQRWSDTAHYNAAIDSFTVSHKPWWMIISLQVGLLYIGTAIEKAIMQEPTHTTSSLATIQCYYFILIDVQETTKARSKANTLCPLIKKKN